jgi:hypothetical protein
MRKLLLMSVFFATIVIPMRYARDKNAHRSLVRTIRSSLLFYIVYWLALMVVYDRL